jgi:hypothetical protein
MPSGLLSSNIMSPLKFSNFDKTFIKFFIDISKLEPIFKILLLLLQTPMSNLEKTSTSKNSLRGEPVPQTVKELSWFNLLA